MVPTSRNFAKSDPGIAEVQWSRVPVSTVFSDVLFPAEMHNQQLQERAYICFKKKEHILMRTRFISIVSYRNMCIQVACKHLLWQFSTHMRIENGEFEAIHCNNIIEHTPAAPIV